MSSSLTIRNHIGASSFGSFAAVGERVRTGKATIPRYFLAAEVGEYCQLSCRHCIYHAVQPAKPADAAPLPDVMDRLEEFFEKADRQLTYVSFAGKEPTIYPHELIKMAGKAVEHCGRTILMTNGLRLGGDLLERAKVVIKQFDISLDGEREAHDQMRRMIGAFDRTMTRVENILKRGRVPVGLIATAINGILPDGRRQVEAIVSLARELRDRFGDHPKLSLSISLYYDRPGHPMLLTEDDLVELAVGLRESGLRSRILWTANYAHLWPVVSHRLGLAGRRVFYDAETDIPFLWDGNLGHVLFNLAETHLLAVRVARSGDVFLGCNHLTLGGDARPHRLGNILEEDLAELLGQLERGNHPLMKRVNQLPAGCGTCPDFEGCRGGDPLSGIYFKGTPGDPFCPRLRAA